jgi:hypothetical protein
MGLLMRTKRRIKEFIGYVYVDPEEVAVMVSANRQFACYLPPGDYRPQWGKDKIAIISTAPKGVSGTFSGKSADGFNFQVVATVGFSYDPMTIENAATREKFAYRCSKMAEWPENIMKMLLQDAIKKTVAAYDAEELISGRIFTNIERDVRHKLQNVLNAVFAGFALMRVQVNDVQPPANLTEAMENGRQVSLVAQESLSHLSPHDLANVMKVVRMVSMLNGQTEVMINQIEYGEGVKGGKNNNVTILPTRHGRGGPRNIPPANNHQAHYNPQGGD